MAEVSGKAGLTGELHIQEAPGDRQAGCGPEGSGLGSPEGGLVDAEDRGAGEHVPVGVEVEVGDAGIGEPAVSFQADIAAATDDHDGVL